jgi:hypothetical protein
LHHAKRVIEQRQFVRFETVPKLGLVTEVPCYCRFDAPRDGTSHTPRRVSTPVKAVYHVFRALFNIEGVKSRSPICRSVACPR